MCSSCIRNFVKKLATCVLAVIVRFSLCTSNTSEVFVVYHLWIVWRVSPAGLTLNRNCRSMVQMTFTSFSSAKKMKFHPQSERPNSLLICRAVFYRVTNSVSKPEKILLRLLKRIQSQQIKVVF